ncbi:MAG: NAD(P)/FAD-dependent oxidoreductase [Pseudonocardia sp.]|nr:NAD(P)/FAD-dependent oxidoreductase [Pseudonocardia sp.]
MYDVVVVGGGPAGLSAAVVLGRQRRRVLVVDAGEPRNARAAEMHMYLGRDGGSPAALLVDGRAEVDAYPTVERRIGRVVSVEGETDGFDVELVGAGRESARRLLLATGQMDTPADVPGLGERWGTSVFHCPFCHGYETTGKTLAVLGNGVGAMLAAYVRDRFSDDVVLCTNGPSTLPPPVAELLPARGISVVETPLTAVEGELDGLTLRFADGSSLARDAVYHRAPTHQSADLAAQLGAELLPDGCVQVDEFGRTTVAGVFAAGDSARLAALPDALTLVGPGAADGVRAAVWLEQELFRSELPFTPGG